MILTDAQWIDIITDRPNRRLINTAKTYTQKLLMHVKGIGMDRYIEKIMAFEKQDLVMIRKKYAVSNKAMFVRINRPTDKVFSAKGGSAYYNVGESQSNAIKDYLSNLVDGYTIKQWLQVFWMPAVGYDPMGLIMMEMDGNGNPFPTYKSILDIYEYLPNNRNIEYVIFKINAKDYGIPIEQFSDAGDLQPQAGGDPKLQIAVKEGAGTAAELYRIIDDKTDRIVKVSNRTITDVLPPIPNYWEKVPASIISNIYDPALGMFISSEDEIIDLADQFLRDGSVKNLIMNYHGFPKAWEYQTNCPECRGTGDAGGRQCSACKGTGKKAQSFPEETIRLPVPKDKDQPVLAPDIGGYITPPIEGIKMYIEQLDALEDLMFETKWGTHQQQGTKKGESETATGRFIDVQPVNDRLNKYADAAEMMETFITDCVGQVFFGLQYKGASITYGRRFLVETPEAIWDKLMDARSKGAPTAALYDLYNDYLQARYSANAMEMQKMLKLAKIEPLPWVKYEEFARLQTFPDIILRRKFWYESWMNIKTDPEILYGDVTVLQKDFNDYCAAMDKQLNTDVEANPNIDTVANPAPAVIPGNPQKGLPQNKAA